MRLPTSTEWCLAVRGTNELVVRLKLLSRWVNLGFQYTARAQH